MPITIGSNISSLRAQRSLAKQSDSLSTIFKRLSSGSRINKAADDAAGLAIAEALRSDTLVYSQGIRNLNDGISYLNIADGALNELSNVVVRIRELAEQAANGIYSTEQRNALQEEVTALQSEYNRIINSTEFNGQKILTGENTKTLLQGGYGTAEQLVIQIGDAALEGANDLRAGATVRIDTNSEGVLANDEVIVNSISADGRYITFSSSANNLVTGDTNARDDVFIKDTLTGETRRVSTDSSGNEGNSYSSRGSISADGRYVAFTSNSSNLVAGDTNGAVDTFIKDLFTGEVKIVSTDSSGNQGNGIPTSSANISADGRYVVFASDSNNLVAGDTNGVNDAFIKDTLTGETKRISTDSDGNQGNGLSHAPNVSADGRYVVFQSYSSNLVAGDTNGVSDLFLKDTLTGEVKRISTDSSGNEANAASTSARISADGRYVAFRTTASNLVAGDTNGSNDIFLKDTHTGEVKRISTDSLGNEANNSSSDFSISADGRYISFTSEASNLVEGDTNGVPDIFVKDTHTGETRRVSTLSSGADIASGEPGDTYISADGRYVIFGDGDANQYAYLRDLREAGIQEISGMVVSNQASAKITLELAKRYQDEIAVYRAGIGTAMSRAETFSKTLTTSIENYKSAESQITDADIAKESANLVRSKILQDTAAAVLAQANQQPALVLQLL